MFEQKETGHSGLPAVLRMRVHPCAEAVPTTVAAAPNLDAALVPFLVLGRRHRVFRFEGCIAREC
jgi:hypothetical protein